MLDAYYSRTTADKLETVFAGTAIGASPTANRSRYMVLYFDFSTFNQSLPTLEQSFNAYCTIQLEGTLRRNRDIFDDEVRTRIGAQHSTNEKLAELFQHVREHHIPLYVLIDEYDNFANTILSEQGAEAYNAFTHGGGFQRTSPERAERARDCSLEGRRGWAKRRAARPGIGAFYRNFFGTLKAGTAAAGGTA